MSPHRYYDHVVIVFNDGTTERKGGNRQSVHHGVLHIWTEDSTGVVNGHESYPLSSIRSWGWEGT